MTYMSETYHSVVFCVSGTTRDEDDEAEDNGGCTRSKGKAIEEEDKENNLTQWERVKIADSPERRLFLVLSAEQKDRLNPQVTSCMTTVFLEAFPANILISHHYKYMSTLSLDPS